MANRNSPQSPPLQDQVPNQMRIGIEIRLDPNMPELELTPSPVAGDHGSDNFLGLFYRVDVEALEEWADVSNFMMGGLGFWVEEPEVTSNFRDFLRIMYGNNWEKRILHYTTLVIEQLKALIIGFCELPNRSITKKHSGRSDLIVGLLRLRVQLKGLAESGGGGGFLEIE